MADLTYDDATHLLRRMGFGGPAEEINDLVARGREGAVDYLLNYNEINDDSEDQLLKGFGKFIDANFSQLERWWFSKLVLTHRQFEEKMVLFWHNHFATAREKVDNAPFMYAQNQTLRQYALDRFDTLLLKVAQDPAMLAWLDGIVNVAGHANENFARELQELFTMGVTDVVSDEPNYDEKDVKETPDLACLTPATSIAIPVNAAIQPLITPEAPSNTWPDATL